jgi:hypothetical protein
MSPGPKGLAASDGIAAHVTVASAVLVLSIWLSSGTMAPYAATLPEPLVKAPCGYLYNIDHEQFRATFSLLAGSPRQQWEDSVVLRRLLFPLFAYPFMKLLGFEVGGFAASLVLHLATFLAFVAFIRRDSGRTSAIAAAWLLATYPGIAYWASLPYSYAAIVPCSLLIFILMRRLETAPCWTEAAGLCALMGICFVAYDFLPIFGVAALLLLARRRVWAWIPPAIAAFILPTMISVQVLRLAFKVPFSNANTLAYRNVVGSWMHPDWTTWKPLLAHLPVIAVDNYLFANFLFLPMLFAGVLVLSVWRLRVRLTPGERMILAAAALLFLFNNAAPPYPGWQMRGVWIARLYQPIFVVCVAYLARALNSAAAPFKNALGWLVATTVLLDATVSFGPVFRVPWTGEIYHRFYRHSTPDALQRNLDRYGRRPLGICRSS